MVKLTNVIKPKNTIDKMMDAVNETPLKQENRHYNGLSTIGEKCLRRLQFNHYDCLDVSFSNRMIRLFGVGHTMEPKLRAELSKFLGMAFKGDQDEVIGFAGHWKGHIDGMGMFLKDSPYWTFDDDWFLMEYKTHKASSFADVKKNGVKKSKPMHYGQMTSYMGYKKLGKCLYVAYNKDTSEIYLEWVLFDAGDFSDYKRKESEVVMADTLLPRIGNDSPMWFECKLCDAHGVCFGKTPIKKSCKNCEHVDILDDGIWSCTKGESIKGYVPCDKYERMEIFNVD